MPANPIPRIRARALHWGALAAGVMCLGWAILSLASFLLPLGVIAGIVAFTFLLLAVRQVHDEARTPLAAGAVLGLVPLAVWAIVFLVSLPVKFGEDPDTGRLSPGNQDLQQVAYALGEPLFLITAGAAALALYALWGNRERVLALSGLAIAVLVQLLTYWLTDIPATLGTLFMLFFALGFIAVGVACLFPLRTPAAAGGPFRAAPRSEG